MASQKETEKKLKAYLKAGKGAYHGKKRAKKKLRKMAENDIISVIAKHATNHPEWYTKLGGDLIGLNFGAIDQLGSRSDMIKDQNGHIIKVATTTDAVVFLALTAPQGGNVLRTAAQKIVNELRLVSGANTIYDVDDMMDYLLNIRSIWASLTQIRRAIRCLNASDPYDIDAWRKYLMMALNDTNGSGTATGFSEEFRSKAANIINWLNTVVKAVRFMMPGNFALFERTSWLFTNIFVDGTGVKFGTKMFVAKEVPIYSHVGDQHTGVTYQLFGAGQTVDQLMTTVNDMVSEFTTKVANVAIAGDLMKAYGMASFYNPGQISFEEKVPFIYDERALEQIANADVLFDRRCVGSYNYKSNVANLVLQVPSGLSISAKEYATRTATYQVKFVNTEDNTVTSGETLSLTRLKCTVEPKFANSVLTEIQTVDCGSEVVVDYVYMIDFTANNGHTVLLELSTIGFVRAPNAYPQQTINLMRCWSCDDYSPMFMLWDPTETPGTADWAGYPVFDFSNWAMMSVTEERQFHKTACLSLLTPTASVIQQAVAKL